MEHFPAIPDYLLVILFGILIPFISGVRSAAAFKQLQVPFDTQMKRRFYLGNSFFLFLMAAVGLFIWWIYNRPFSQLGFRLPGIDGRPVQWWLVPLFVGIYAMDLIHSIYHADTGENQLAEQQQTPFVPTQWRDLPAYTLMCLSAGIFEEIIFRGYMINFFSVVFKGLALAGTLTVLVPALLFSLAHYYQGWQAVFKILVISLLFGMIFWHSGSLYVVIILHFLIDLIGGLVSILMSRRNASHKQ